MIFVLKEKSRHVPISNFHRNVSVVYGFRYSRESHIVFTLSYSLGSRTKVNQVISNARNAISNPFEAFANGSCSTIQTVVHHLLEGAGSSVGQKNTEAASREEGDFPFLADA